MWWIADRIMAGCSDKRIGKRKHREEIPDAFLVSGVLKYKKRGGNYHLVTTGGAVCGQVADTVRRTIQNANHTNASKATQHC